MKRLFFLLFSVLIFNISIYANWQGAGYYRVQGDFYKRFISVIGNTFSTSTNPDAFQYCIKMDTVGKQFVDPGTVIYINTLGSGASLQAQGENTKDLISYDFKFKRNEDGTIEAYYNAFLWTMYLQDYNTGIDVGKTETYAKFNLLPLDNEDNYFAVVPDVEYNGYYYTTLRVAFNYKLPDNVYAYIIKSKKLTLYASPGQIIPANYQVILKCSSSAQEQNKLLPTVETALSPTTNDLLKALKYHKYTIHKGQFTNGSGGSGNNVIVQVNQGDAKTTDNSTYRVLGVKDGKLGFYEKFWDEQLRLHNGANAVTCLDGNRAYMVVSTEDANGGITLLETPTITPATSEYEAGESVELTISSEATKTGATIQFKIDNGEWQNYTGSFSLTSDEMETEDVTHIVSFRTVNAGINSSESSESYTFIAPKTITVGDIPNAEENVTYRITDPLIVAYPDIERGVIYAKDDNGAPSQEANEGETDFVADRFGDRGHYGDFSNWVAVKVSNWPSDLKKDDKIDVMGKVIDVVNRTIQGRAVKRTDNATFNANTYCVVNFMGEQHVTSANGKPYFFATPQPNEIVQMIWAMWDETNNCFRVPNRSGFDGAIYTNFSYYNNTMPTLVDGHEYMFLGLVRRETATQSVLLQSASPTTQYVIYPLSGLEDMNDNEITTGTSELQVEKSVVGVKYYNLMGVESDAPFKGVNIVVTSYDNGTRSTSKVIK